MISIITIFSAIIITEFVGYFMHKILHTGKIKWLSESHMVHHLELYPSTSLRTEEYKIPPHAKFLGIGVEWLLPVVIVLTVVGGLFTTLEISYLYFILYCVASIGYALVFLSWMHDQFHLKSPILRKNRFFKKARRLHDRHHVDMKINFGISFYVLDRLFGTFSTHKKT